MRKNITIIAVALVIIIAGLTTKMVSAATDSYYGYYNQPYNKFGYGSKMTLQANSAASSLGWTTARCYNTGTSVYVLETGIFEYGKNSNGVISITNEQQGAPVAVSYITNINYVEESLARHYNYHNKNQ